jgi:hypothetical protein
MSEAEKLDITEMFTDMEPVALRSIMLERRTGWGEAALLSIAVSLKRIADTLDGTAAGVPVGRTIFGRGNQP